MAADLRPAEPLAWHRRPHALARFVTDLVTDELSQLRPGGARPPPPPWSPELAIDEQGLGLDSLERLSIASALSEALHLHESGIEDWLLAKRRFGQWLEVAAEGLAAFDATLSLRSPDGIGAALATPHALAGLRQAVEPLAQRLPHTRRVLAAVPAHHRDGFLFTVLLPDCLGCDEVLDIRQTAPMAVAAGMRAGDVVVSHPSHWSVLAQQVARFPPGVRGITATAPCPEPLAQRLQDLGLEALLQAGAGAQTAGIALQR